MYIYIYILYIYILIYITYLYIYIYIYVVYFWLPLPYATNEKNSLVVALLKSLNPTPDNDPNWWAYFEGGWYYANRQLPAFLQKS